MDQIVVKSDPRARQGLSCPLGHGQLTALQDIKIADLASAWSRRFGIDVRPLFAGLAEDRLRFCRCAECGLRFFAPGIAGDGAFYKALSQWYDRWTGHVAGAEFKADYGVALPHVEPRSRVLEIGAGCARFDRHLPGGSTYVGLELNPEYVERARAEGVDLRLESIEAHALRHAGEYDVVCLFQVIEHIADLRSFVAACVDCVRPGGLLIVGCPNADGFLGAETDNLLNMPPHHVSWFSRGSLEFLARAYSLAVVRIVEETLEHQYRRAFMDAFWLKRLSAAGSAGGLAIAGTRYRVSRLIASILSKLTAGWPRGFEQCIKGHTITAVFRKPADAAG